MRTNAFNNIQSHQQCLYYQQMHSIFYKNAQQFLKIYLILFILTFNYKFGFCTHGYRYVSLYFR